MNAIGLVVAAAYATGGAVAQPRVNAEAAAMAAFSSRIHAYAALATRLTSGLPALDQTHDSADIASRETAFGDAIRSGRLRARPGDVLTSDVARLIRRAVKADFRARPRNMRRQMLEDIPRFRPRVNQSYPSSWPLATFPASLLAKLPPLPEGIEYRLLSEALILHDVRANIIVDFMLDVL